MNQEDQSYNAYKEFLEIPFEAQKGSPRHQIAQIDGNFQNGQGQINRQIMQPYQEKSQHTLLKQNGCHQLQISNTQVACSNTKRPFSPELPQKHNLNIFHSYLSQNITLPQNAPQQLGSYEHASMKTEQKSGPKLNNSQIKGSMNKYRRALHIIDQKSQINKNQSNKLFPKTKRRRLATQTETQVSFNLSFNEESMAKYRKILADFELIKDQQKPTETNPRDRYSLSTAKDVLADLHQKRQYNSRNGRGHSFYRSLNKYSLYESPEKNQERIIVFIKTYVYSHLQSVSIEISLLSDTLVINCKLIGKVNQMLKLVLDEQKAERLYKESFNDWEVLGKRISIQTTQSGMKYLRILSLRQLISSLKSQLQPDDLTQIQASQRKQKLKKLKQKMKQQDFIKRNYFSFIEKNQSRLDHKSEIKIPLNDGNFQNVDHSEKLNKLYSQAQNEKQKSNKRLIGNARKKLSRLTKHLDYLSPDVKDKVISIRQDYLKDLAEKDKDSKQKSQNEEFVKRIRRLFERLSKPKQTLKPIEKKNDFIGPSKPQIMIQEESSCERKQGGTAREKVNESLLGRQNIRNSQKLTKFHNFSSQLPGEQKSINSKKQIFSQSNRKNSFRQFILKRESDRLRRSGSQTGSQTQNDNWIDENKATVMQGQSIEEERQMTEMQISNRVQEDGIEGENNKAAFGNEKGNDQMIGLEVEEVQDEVCQSQEKAKLNYQEVEGQIQIEDKNQQQNEIQDQNQIQDRNQCEDESQNESQKSEAKSEKENQGDYKNEIKSESSQKQQIEENEISNEYEDYQESNSDEDNHNSDISDEEQQLGKGHKQNGIKVKQSSLQIRANAEHEHIDRPATTDEKDPQLQQTQKDNNEGSSVKQTAMQQQKLINNKQGKAAQSMQSSLAPNDKQELKSTEAIKINGQQDLIEATMKAQGQKQVDSQTNKHVDSMQLKQESEDQTQKQKQLQYNKVEENHLLMSIKIVEHQNIHIEQSYSVEHTVSIQHPNNTPNPKENQSNKQQSPQINQTNPQTQTQTNRHKTDHNLSSFIKRLNTKSNIPSNTQTLQPLKQTILKEPKQLQQIVPSRSQSHGHQLITHKQAIHQPLNIQQTLHESNHNTLSRQQKSNSIIPIETVKAPNKQQRQQPLRQTYSFQQLKKSQPQISKQKTQQSEEQQSEQKQPTIKYQQQILRQKTEQDSDPKAYSKQSTFPQTQYDRSNTKQQSIGQSKSKTLLRQSNQQICEKYEALEPHFNLNAKFILIQQSQISQYLKNFYQSISPLEAQMLPYTQYELQKLIKTNLSLNKTIDFFDCNSLGWFEKQKRKYLLLGSLECVHLIAQKYGAIQIQTFRIFKKESLQQRKYLVKYIKDFEKIGFLYQKKMKTQGLYEIKGIIKIPKQIVSKNFELPQQSLKFTSTVSIGTPLAQPKDYSLEIQEKHNNIFWRLLGDCLITELTRGDLQKYIDSCKTQSKYTQLFIESLQKQQLSEEASSHIFREDEDTFTLEVYFDLPYIQRGKQTFLSLQSYQYNLGTNNEKIYLASQNNQKKMGDNQISEKLLIFKAQKSIIKENYLEAYLKKKVNEINNSKPQKSVYLFVPSFNIKSNLRMTEDDDFKKSFVHCSNIVCDLLPSSISVSDSLPTENREIIELREQNPQKGFVFCVCSCMGDKIQQVMAGSWIGHKDQITYDQFS